MNWPSDEIERLWCDGDRKKTAREEGTGEWGLRTKLAAWLEDIWCTIASLPTLVLGKGASVFRLLV